jgi:hypothetical protein
MNKPRYSVKWFKRRFEYPTKNCSRCGARLLPKIRTNGTLETPNEFIRRNTCGRKSACLGVNAKGSIFPLPPTKPSLSHVREDVCDALATALRRHDPDFIQAWKEVERV